MDAYLILAFLLNFIFLYYAIFWILTYCEKKEKMAEVKEKRNYPKVSILIPAHNEEKFIARAIDSCLNLNYPGEVEVIVIDDGSTDRTAEIAREYEKKGLIRLLSKKQGGKASALNYGLKFARGEMISCLDADSFYEKNALLNLVSMMKPGVSAVVPIVKILKPKSMLEKFQYLEYLMAAFFAKLFSFLNCIYVIPGPGSVYKKDLILEMDGFAEWSLTEDMEIAMRMHKHAYKRESCLSAIVFTEAPPNFKAFFKQRLRWNTGFLDNLSIHRDLISPRYGNLGAFLLPFILISISSAFLYLFAVFIRPIMNYIEGIYYLSKVGFDFWVFLRIDLILNLLSLNVLQLMSITCLSTYMLLLFACLNFFYGERWKKKVPLTLLFVSIYPILLSIISIFSVFNFFVIKYRRMKGQKGWRKS